MVTTIALMTNVAPSNTGKFPASVARLMTAPSPVMENVWFRNQTFSITGLGAVISRATDAGNFPVLLGATFVISAMVVTINRLIWRRLYALASTRFKLEFT